MSELSVALIGLGLIGGSFARDLAALGVRVTATDTDEPTLRTAIEAGVVADSLGPSLEGIEDADVVVLAVPVSTAIDLLASAGDRLRAAGVVSDVCSTKRSIIRAARHAGLADTFIGGHPLAGDHRAGWHASRRGLFDGATVYLCPAGAIPADRVDVLRSLWERVGARPEWIDENEHDRLVAMTSHLPQAVSSALARAIAAAGIDQDRLGQGGRDMTRLAASPAALWASIALDNGVMLGAAIEALESELASLRDALSRSDREALLRFFSRPHPVPPSDA